MRSKLTYIFTIILLTSAAITASAQADYAAHEARPSLTAGGGFSIFSVDKAGAQTNAILGPTVWVDWKPTLITHLVGGLGIEFEGRDLLWNRSVPAGYSVSSQFYEYTLGGGPVYHPAILRFHGFQPYFKGTISYGYINTFPIQMPNPTNNPYLHHLSDVTYAFGAGVDYPVTNRIAVRADYEYQLWPNFPNLNDVSKISTPNGVTIGAMYSFHGRYR